MTNNDEFKDEFLYPQNTYHGKNKPNNLIFNAKLQKFSQRISYIVSLQNNGKISTEEAYQQMEALWEDLELSKEQLEIEKNPDEDEEDNYQ